MEIEINTLYVINRMSMIWHQNLNDLVEAYFLYIEKFNVTSIQERAKIMGAYLEIAKNKNITGARN